jgi:hypothetical protein
MVDIRRIDDVRSGVEVDGDADIISKQLGLHYGNDTSAWGALASNRSDLRDCGGGYQEALA